MGQPASNSHNPCIPKDPDYLLGLQLIPPHLMKHIPKDRKPGPISAKQRCGIRRILNMRHDQPFNRCGGTRVDGDKCRGTAGMGTKGDFYGLGIETGIYGVGYCAKCIKHHHILPGIVLKNARSEVERMQQYRGVAVDTEYEIKAVNTEIALAEEKSVVRAEVTLLAETLKDFNKEILAEKRGESEKTAILKQILDELKDHSVAEDVEQYAKTMKRLKQEIFVGTNLTEYAGGHLGPMSYTTRMNASVRLATGISKLALDDIKLDKTEYVHIADVLTAVNQMRQVIMFVLIKAEELFMAKHVRGEEIETDQPIRDYVLEIAAKKWAVICKNLKSNVGRKK